MQMLNFNPLQMNNVQVRNLPTPPKTLQFATQTETTSEPKMVELSPAAVSFGDQKDTIKAARKLLFKGSQELLRGQGTRDLPNGGQVKVQFGGLDGRPGFGDFVYNVVFTSADGDKSRVTSGLTATKVQLEDGTIVKFPFNGKKPRVLEPKA